jgi:6-pyruvoyl-tetrahydropterin synthase
VFVLTTVGSFSLHSSFPLTKEEDDKQRRTHTHTHRVRVSIKTSKVIEKTQG